jgi:N-acetylmuramoyl-L-alanine amidase CwlA
MNLHKLILTENNCYKSGKKHTVKGIVVHSTGANNPTLKRYVGPDDGLLGKNQYNNHWNTAKPGGREVCVHAFIGKLADGNVATYQTLPWDIVGWHSGSGSLGYAKNANNNGYIGFEICEDGLTDKVYFEKVYAEAVDLCAYLCKLYNIKPESPSLICHSEGHKLGIASNHGDVMHWWPKHGKNMDTFRADVKAVLDDMNPPAATPVPTAPATPAVPSGSIQKGDVVKLAADAVYYSGKAIPAWVKEQNWVVKEVKGDRAVIDKNESGTNSICSPVNVKFLTAVKSSAPAAPIYEIYTVVKGDSLWKIAAAKLGNGARYKEIKTLNGLSGDTIYAGQKLKIPQK